MKKLSYWFLTFAEHIYLYVHGWQKLGREKYAPPTDFPFKKHPSYGRVHAVNAQRQAYADKS